MPYLVQLFQPRTRRFLKLNRMLGDGIGDLLSSQLLLENAIKHGLAEMLTPGVARIRARREEDSVRIDVEDSAGAFEPAGRDKDGLGLQIVEKRIQAVLGSASRLDIHCIPNELTRVTLRLPLLPAEAPWPH